MTRTSPNVITTRQRRLPLSILIAAGLRQWTVRLSRCLSLGTQRERSVGSASSTNDVRARLSRVSVVISRPAFLRTDATQKVPMADRVILHRRDCGESVGLPRSCSPRSAPWSASRVATSSAEPATPIDVTASVLGMPNVSSSQEPRGRSGRKGEDSDVPR